MLVRLGSGSPSQKHPLLGATLPAWTQTSSLTHPATGGNRAAAAPPHPRWRSRTWTNASRERVSLRSGGTKNSLTPLGSGNETSPSSEMFIFDASNTTTHKQHGVLRIPHSQARLFFALFWSTQLGPRRFRSTPAASERFLGGVWRRRRVEDEGTWCTVYKCNM